MTCLLPILTHCGPHRATPAERAARPAPPKAAYGLPVFFAILCASCSVTQPAPAVSPVEPRSVAEAVGMAELALAPMAVACSRPGDPSATTWCRSYAGDELAEVMRRWGPAAVVGVAAHERGHTIGYAPEGLRYGDVELLADAWTGCALARTGLDVGPYLAVVAGLDAADYAERRRATMAGMEVCR